MLLTFVMLVSHYHPSDIGHGGVHRSYQVLHDLELVLGPENVGSVSFDRWRKSTSALQTQSSGTPSLISKLRQSLPPDHFGRRVWRAFSLPYRLARSLGHELRQAQDNPFRLFAGTGFSTDVLAPPQFISYYESVLDEIPRPAICVIEHTGFAGLQDVNQARNIPTVLCGQNLESLDMTLVDHNRRASMYAALTDLALELQVMSRCSARLFISKVETGLVGGIGIPAYYYPYRPVGSIRDRLLSIRRKRTSESVNPTLFLLLGSASHITTRDSLEWFLRQMQSHGLPESVHVIVAGSQSEQFSKLAQSIENLQVLGWVPQSELDDLLTRCAGVLVPQHRGFGALTRLPELACAGIPVIVSKHAALAIDIPPGVFPVSDDWTSWSQSIFKLTISSEDSHLSCSLPAYLAWETSQPQPLSSVVRSLV